jgi:cephalosporin hydroxylase
VELEAVVVADTPSMEVESSPLVPNVATRFRRTVRHGTGGVFYARTQISAGSPRELLSLGISSCLNRAAFQLSLMLVRSRSQR